jgi:hypothetical protein
MGNCSSIDEGSWQQQYNTLKFQTDEAIERYKKSTVELTEQREKAVEQGNLVRFKMEVLINMLAIEEKKIETSEKRLETLKWVLLSHGISQNTVSNLIDGSGDNIKGLKMSLEKKLADFDLTTAIVKMTKDFEAFRTDIIQCFADDDGKIVATLSRDEFMRQLYSVTENISKNDCQLIALRFFDGSSVSVAEFLNFFTTPAATRQAKAAAAAVRMSLDLLDLDISLSEFPETPALPPVPGSSATIRTNALDNSVQKLLVLWPIVIEQLMALSQEIRNRLNGSEIIMDAEFKAELLKVCGSTSDILKKFVTQSNEKAIVDLVKPLSSDDIDMVSERFEIGGRVHFGHFLQFFNELVKANNRTITDRDGTSDLHSPVYMTPGGPFSPKGSGQSLRASGSRPVVPMAASPFRSSSEWKNLKHSASHRYEHVDDDDVDADLAVNVRTKKSNSVKLSHEGKPPMTPVPEPLTSAATESKAPVLLAPSSSTKNVGDATESKATAAPAASTTAPPAKAPKPAFAVAEEKLPADGSKGGQVQETAKSSAPADTKGGEDAKANVIDEAKANDPNDGKSADPKADTKGTDAKADSKPSEVNPKTTEIDPAAGGGGCFGICFAAKKPVPDPSASPAVLDAGAASTAAADAKQDASPAAASQSKEGDNSENDEDDGSDFEQAMSIEDIRKKLQLEDQRNQDIFGGGPDVINAHPTIKQADSPVRLPKPKAKPGSQNIKHHESNLKEKLSEAARRNIDRDNAKTDDDDTDA